jgi:nitroreductase/predicted lactoylglutathione lyase
MSGILFLQTTDPAPLREFYTKTVGCEIWLEQADCILMRHGNFIFGFCKRDKVQADAMLTFFYETRDEVDAMYEKVRDIAKGPPSDNEKYNIYQFFATDPDGRMVEFQHFSHPMPGYWSGDDLLRRRRSVRDFAPDAVDEDTLNRVVELARWAPSSYNRQAFYFKIVRDRETVEWLGDYKGDNSAPIKQAPMAVAVVADTEVSPLPVEDGTLATHQFMLAAAWHGLGTCWIGHMNQDDVKERLDIPNAHHLVTVTPLGRPAGPVSTPDRHAPERFIR